ncbi:MAG: hypothetical protein IKK33_04250 [Lachnospiraceae bacterium]|nr:hypothetical protein [Lachnospiraceae bacterium]
MEEKTYGKTQHNILEQFYKDYFEKSHIQLGYNVVAIIFFVILMIVMWFPYQTYTEDDRALKLLGLMFGALAAFIYMNSYRYAIDGRGAVTNIYQYLQYLPISKTELRMFRLKKLLRLLLKVYMPAQAGQLLFSLIAYHEITWGNLWFPFVYVFLVPFMVVGAGICVSK